MSIELLLDKKITKNKFKTSERKIININKIKGNENYVLCINTEISNNEDAKFYLSKLDEIVKIVELNGANYTIVTNEPSCFLLKNLYPLCQSFESKLRKFLQIALCDTQDILTEAYDELKKEVIKKIPEGKINRDNSILEYSDLSNIFTFLFSDKEAVETIKSDILKRNNNWKIHQDLKNIKDNTIWNKCFKNKCKFFNFDKYYVELYNYRNDVMHFHNISYKEYISAKKIFENAIRELELELKSNIVLKATEILDNKLFATYAIDKLINELVHNYRHHNEILLPLLKTISNSNYFINNNLRNIPISFKSNLANTINLLCDLKFIRHNAILPDNQAVCHDDKDRE